MNIDDVLASLTLQEKIKMLCGKDNWSTLGFKDKGIDSISMSDSSHGVRKQVPHDDETVYDTLPATCFPTMSALACSFDTELAQQVGAAVGEEAASLGAQLQLGPGINIKRVPICGRNFEYLSEDPVLTGEMSASYINGVQSEGVAACIKHYACNNQEWDRFNISSEVGLRTLREIYLKGFERAIKKSNPWTIMSSYNKLNGTYATENRYLLETVLRREWGYDGVVISDWGACHDHPACLAATMDLAMPYSPDSEKSLNDALEKGEISEAQIDEAVRRILRLVEKTKASRQKCGKPFRHEELAEKAAAGSMVLLKNSGLLPLSKKGRVVIFGYNAAHPVVEGDGSSLVNCSPVPPLDALQKLYGDTVSFVYAGEDFCDQSVNNINIQYARVNALCRDADAVLFFIGTPFGDESESFDRTELNLPRQQENLINVVCNVNPRTAVILTSGSPVVMPWKELPQAILQTGFCGQEMGNALAKILFGDICPSGRLAESYPAALYDLPAMQNYPGENGIARYDEGLNIGYRFYDKADKKPLFPFGFGLSYTTFSYSELRLECDKVSQDGMIHACLTIKNTGDYEGAETVQLYAGAITPPVTRPVRELVAFKKVMLKPQEEKELCFSIPVADLAYFDELQQRFATSRGQYILYAGHSSAELLTQAEFSFM
ncbi:MAG: glycoside hydrolase family 3 C-terminal domain-containing protein [Acutalibacteraceae bacterium]